MSILKYNQENLAIVRSVVESLSECQYNSPIEILSGSSIGAHVRHILEFYICLLRENGSNVICYDDRERNKRIETERGFALVAIDNIVLKLKEVLQDRNLILKSDFSQEGNDPSLFNTSLFRELGYCLEHSIHHEALIKVGIKSIQSVDLPANNFGVAPSTVRFRDN